MQLIIFTDGGSRGNPGAAAIGVVVQQGETVLFETGETIGVATNNEAEYQAILRSLKWLTTTAAPAEISKVRWQLDSKLVVEQLNKRWKIKEPRMREFAQQAWSTLATLPYFFEIVHIPREQNAAADALVNQALDAAV
jgi:probable phosphoglycerate mutase